MLVHVYPHNSPGSQSHYYLYFTVGGLMLTCSDSPKVTALVTGTAVPDPRFLVPVWQLPGHPHPDLPG